MPPSILDHLPDLVRNLAVAVEECWIREDRGIWELRAESDHFFHSKGMCWLALDCAAHLVPRLGLADADRRRWLAVRDRIAAEVHERCWDGERRAWVAGYGLRELDAAVLRCTLFNANDPADPRLRDTLAAIERDLTVGPHVYRYRMDDGLEGDEGSFVACSFWLAGNWALQGRTIDASRRMTELVGCANDLGLLGEEIDPRTGETLGNFPQGFSHMALINGLVRLEEAIARFGRV